MKPLKDSMGRYRLTSLFWETRTSKDLEPLWTTKDEDYKVGGKTYPSLKAIYLSYHHVPKAEYEFAIHNFGSWAHWDALTRSGCMSAIIEQWREELSVRIKCNAIKHIFTASNESSPTGVNAARYLAEEGYLPKKAGRPTSKEKARHLAIGNQVRSEFEDDAARLNITKH